MVWRVADNPFYVKYDSNADAYCGYQLAQRLQKHHQISGFN